MLSIDVGGSVSVELEMAKIEADGSFKYLTEKSVMRTRGLPFQQLVIFSIIMQEEVSHHIKITFMT